MIGFLDSGVGCVQVAKEFRRYFPDADFFLFADTAYAPYGEKDAETIRKRTFLGLDWLFAHGANIVILACNTASACSIKIWQSQYPEKKVLSVTIPGIEDCIRHGYNTVAVLCTPFTHQTKFYENLFREKSPQMRILSFPAPDLVCIAENHGNNEKKCTDAIIKYKKILGSDRDACILGCTHFGIYKKWIGHRPYDIIDPGECAAKAFVSYCERHPQYKKKSGETGKTVCVVSGEKQKFASSVGHIDPSVIVVGIHDYHSTIALTDFMQYSILTINLLSLRTTIYSSIYL